MQLREVQEEEYVAPRDHLESGQLPPLLIKTDGIMLLFPGDRTQTAPELTARPS